MINQEIFYERKCERKKDITFNFDFLDELLQLDCFSIVDRTNDLACLKNERLRQWLEKHKEFLILGIGGSYLGPRSIYAISETLPETLAHSKKKAIFVNNLDACSLKRVFSSIKNLNETGVLCISKSGETLETLTQLLLIFKLFDRQDLSSKIVVITENKPSALRQIAINNDLLCLEHPKTIGGRFSVFSIVGMLPAIMFGIDPLEIRKGGKNILHGDLEPVKNGAAFIVRNLREGITNHVSFAYSDKLAFFADWLAQLYAESSGKSGRGVTPITARGSMDQHSQLQLYLDGPADKCFSFFKEKQKCDASISGIDIPEKYQYLSGKKVSNIFEAQCDATIASLREKKYPLRKFEFADVNSEILGKLFMYFMIEVSCVCNLIGVNPFDQPAVERGKILTKNLLNGESICR